MTGTRGPSCTVPPRLVRRRKPRPAPRRDTSAIGLEAVSAAVAVLTARQDPAADLRSGIAQTELPGRVILGLEIMASAALAVLGPEDKGARALEALGLLALTKGAEQP